MNMPCPHCRAPIRAPLGGQDFLCPRCGMLVGDANQLSDAQMSNLWREQMGRAVASAYSPNWLKLLGLFGLPVALLSQRAVLAPLLGWDETPSWLISILWALAVFFVTMVGMAFSNLVTSLIFWKKTGRMYVQDRVGYARAGGMDIAYWSPIVASTLLFGIFYAAHQGEEFPLAFLWRPWFLPVLTVPLALIVAALASVVVIRRR